MACFISSAQSATMAGIDRLTRRQFLGTAGAVGAGLAFPRLAAGAFAAKPSGFVKRKGARLVLDGKPWRLHGASVYGTSNPGGPNAIAATIQSARDAGLNTLRVVNFLQENGDPTSTAFDENDWRRVDAILAALRAADMKAILDLSTFRNMWQNWTVTGGGTVTPYSRDWSPLIRFVTKRKNTVNKQHYASDPTIALVSFAGEPNPPASGEPLKPTTPELTAFYARVLKEWRKHDSHHLLSNGGFIHLDWEERYGNPNGSGIDWKAIFALPQNDVPAIHTYPDPADRANDYQSPKVAPYCAGLKKPWLTEEFGLSQSIPDATRAAWFADVYGIQSDFGSAGASFWNLGPEVGSNTYDVSAATPLTFAAVQAAAPS